MPDVVVREGQTLTFPLPLEHPLTEHQTYRQFSNKEIRAHPFYGPLLKRRLSGQDSPKDPEQLAGELAIALRHWLGPIYVWRRVGDLEIEAGATVLINQTSVELNYDVATIEGALHVVSPNPRLPVTLTLNCVTLSGVS